MPFESMRKAVPEAWRLLLVWLAEVATAKSGMEVEADEEVAWIEKRAQGEVEPTPTLPPEVTRKVVEVELVVEEKTVVMEKRGMFE